MRRLKKYTFLTLVSVLVFVSMPFVYLKILIEASWAATRVYLSSCAEATRASVKMIKVLSLTIDIEDAKAGR